MRGDKERDVPLHVEQEDYTVQGCQALRSLANGPGITCDALDLSGLALSQCRSIGGRVARARLSTRPETCKEQSWRR